MASSVTVSSFFLHRATNAAVPGITLRSHTLTTRSTTPAQRHRCVAASLPPPPPPGNKYFSVATEELFLDIAALLLENAAKNVNRREANEIPVVRMEEGEWWWRWMKTTAAVAEDPIRPEAVWGQRVRDVSSPGFSFSAAGLLYPYHLGVAQLLIEKGYIKNTTPLAGSSAGAIVCAVIASGTSMHEALKDTKTLAEDCRLRGTSFRLGAVLRDLLNQFLPDDVHIRSSGRVRVSVTEILWRPRCLLVDQFDSKQDLINAVMASSFIPGYFAPEPVTIFRNRLCVDGGITLLTPPTSASHTVRVCAYPASRLGLQGIVISPDCNPENMPSTRELLNWTFKPAADDILDKLFELGYLNATTWAEKNPVEVSSSR